MCIFRHIINRQLKRELSMFYKGQPGLEKTFMKIAKHPGCLGITNKELLKQVTQAVGEICHEIGIEAFNSQRSSNNDKKKKREFTSAVRDCSPFVCSSTFSAFDSAHFLNRHLENCGGRRH